MSLFKAVIKPSTFLKSIVKISITHYEFQGYKSSSQLACKLVCKLLCFTVVLSQCNSEYMLYRKVLVWKLNTLFSNAVSVLHPTRWEKKNPHSRIFFHCAMGMLDMMHKSFMKLIIDYWSPLDHRACSWLHCHIGDYVQKPPQSVHFCEVNAVSS